MQRIALAAMALVLGLGQSANVSADDLNPNPTACSKNIVGSDYCHFQCPDGWFIEWTGTAATVITGHAECGGQETPECTTATTCTRTSPNPGSYDNWGQCLGSGTGFVACKAVPPQGF